MEDTVNVKPMPIRKAEKTDLAELQVLSALLDSYRSKNFSTTTEKFHDRKNARPSFIASDFDGSIILVSVNEDEKIVGFIRGSVEERKEHVLSKLGHIEEFYVIDEVRGTGVATNLFKALEADFKIIGCNLLTTHTDFENELSQKFYVKAGMIPATVELWKEL